MQKICLNCGEYYQDITKRKVGKTCSKQCASQLMVNKRNKNGSYIMNLEQKQKISSSLKESYENGSRLVTISEAHEAVKDKDRTCERIKRQKQTNVKKYGVEHWSQTLEGRKKISKIHSGKICSPEQLKKMSLASREKLKNTNMYSLSKKGIRKDLNCFFRSTWEANYARYLNFIGINWKYESVTYELGNSISYTPDFILEDGIHIEIKGWLTKKGAEKLSLFKTLHPSVNLLIIDREKYNEIKSRYQFDILNWEK